MTHSSTFYVLSQCEKVKPLPKLKSAFMRLP